MLFIVCDPFIRYFPVTVYLVVTEVIDPMAMTGGFLEHYRFEREGTACWGGGGRGGDLSWVLGVFSGQMCGGGSPKSEIRSPKEGRRSNVLEAARRARQLRGSRLAALRVEDRSG